MARTKLGTGRLALLALLALVLPMAALTGPARAADPVATTTRVFWHSGPSPEVRFYLDARVRTANKSAPKGTVTWYLIGSNTPIAGPATVDSTGLATAELTIDISPANVNDQSPDFEARFTGASGYADSVGDEGQGGPLVVTPQPTVLGLGGPTLIKLPLTTSVNVFRSDGLPAEGLKVVFSLFGSAFDYNQNQTVCVTAVDKNGLASCKGAGLLASIVSILSSGAYASMSQFGEGKVVHLQAFTVG
jgi:hypothetical protein